MNERMSLEAVRFLQGTLAVAFAVGLVVVLWLAPDYRTDSILETNRFYMTSVRVHRTPRIRFAPVSLSDLEMGDFVVPGETGTGTAPDGPGTGESGPGEPPADPAGESSPGGVEPP